MFNKRIHKFLILLFVICFFSARSFSQDDLDFQQLIHEVDSSGIFYSNNYYTWCSTVIKGEDGKYHMFYSRWTHGKRSLDDDSMNYIFNGFQGWNKYSEIAYAVSNNLNGPYKYVSTVLKGDGKPGHWDRFAMHNPQIRKFGDYYYLYYISNSFDSSLHFKNESEMSKDWIHWLKYN